MPKIKITRSLIVLLGILCTVYLIRYCRMVGTAARDTESRELARLMERADAIRETEGKNDRACSQEYRKTRIQDYCEERRAQGDQSVLAQLNSTKINDAFFSIYAVPKKKLLFCIPYKSGSTTWQTLLAKNFLTREEIGDQSEMTAGKSFNVIHQSFQPGSTVQDVLDRYKDYYKILLARHPFDKLESVSNALLDDRILFRDVKNQIKEMYHPELNVTHPYQPGTFNMTDLLRYMRSDPQHYARRHFTPNYLDCMPCQIRYDYVMKIETMATDQSYVVEKKMNGVGEHLKANVQRPRKGALAWGGKDLPVFRSVSPELVFFAQSYYGHDMELYGYQYEPQSRLATCMNPVADDNDGEICC